MTFIYNKLRDKQNICISCKFDESSTCLQSPVRGIKLSLTTGTAPSSDPTITTRILDSWDRGRADVVSPDGARSGHDSDVIGNESCTLIIAGMLKAQPDLNLLI